MTVGRSTHAFQTFSIARDVALLMFALLAAVSGCAADAGLLDETTEPVAVDEAGQALQRGGGGMRLGYTCSNGVCECDKSIENDCEDMSGVCTDASLDDLIACIDGWLTTHCTCTQIRSGSAGAVGGVRTTAIQGTAVYSIAN
jgi:hypothetical protein